jgi:hypothetical protein
MERNLFRRIATMGSALALASVAAVSLIQPAAAATPAPSATSNADNYTLEQAMSDNAQLSTIAFSGLAFIAGNTGADTFFPPGKVADFFGFQYMRDIDAAGYGHNTTFLSRVANNVLLTLNASQKAQLVALAKTQGPLYSNFAYNRLPLMAAFRQNLNGKAPSGSKGLNTSAVSKYTAALYGIDADLSYNRAITVGKIIRSLTDSQKAYLAKMKFGDYSTWPDVPEDQAIKVGLTNTQYVAVMTYASELFSWYAGSLYADVYFCPERHGTYFGGFFMKDYPAMNNPDYFIDTSTTGDLGQQFLQTLNATQKTQITGIIDVQRPWLKELVTIRETVSKELRKAIAGQTVNKALVYSSIARYGELDGLMSGLYATRFAAVNKTLTADQRAALVKLRSLAVVPKGVYKYASLVTAPALPSVNYLFGVGAAPSTQGKLAAPAAFAKAG